MRPKVKIIVFLFIVLSQLSCERDEICLEDITPKFIIRFYNANDPNVLRAVNGITVNIIGVDGDYENETITLVTDSIAIPLLVTENKTSFVLTIPGDDPGINDNRDTITLTYTQQDIFVSRSCGYKTVYNDAEEFLVDDNDNWIKGFQTKDDPQQIIDENAAHAEIYH